MTTAHANRDPADREPWQPTSDHRHRAVLIAGVRAVIDSNKRARTAPTDRKDTHQP